MYPESVYRRFEGAVHPFPAADAPPPSGLVRFLWNCTSGMRGHLLWLAMLVALVGLFEAFLYGVLEALVDWLATIRPGHLWSEHPGRLAAIGGALAASCLVVGLLALFKHQALASNFPMRLRWRLHTHMLGQSASFYQDEHAGRIASKVMQTAAAAREVWMILADIVVFVLTYFVTMLVLVGSSSPWLLLPFAGWLAAYAVALRYFVPRMTRLGERQADANSLMAGRIGDAYLNIHIVKLFSHARREAAYARGAMEDLLKASHEQMRLVSAWEFVNHTLSMALVGATAFVALWLWDQGLVGAGAIAATSAMSLRLIGLSDWIMWEVATLFEHVGTVQDGMNTFSRPHSVVDAPDAAELRVAHGEIRFENIGFSYGGAPVIDKLSLHIRPGEKVGLVGRSGAGKSTLVNLLLRSHDLQEGRILVDGQDIRRVTQESLRSCIGMVTQDTSLLHRSVRENIVYGRPEASDDEMVAAARRAQAHDFICGLVDPAGRTGYDAQVGERGVRLSGGQRQRIAIARVLLKDAPILLLDEATSALDSEAEAAIQASLYSLMQGKTVVAIAHRLSTIAAMDRLVVMDHGRIVEEGDHRSLLAKGGLYAQLWRHQSGGFLGDAAAAEHASGRFRAHGAGPRNTHAKQ